jgi:hypothetical protein
VSNKSDEKQDSYFASDGSPGCMTGTNHINFRVETHDFGEALKKLTHEQKSPLLEPSKSEGPVPIISKNTDI